MAASQTDVTPTVTTAPPAPDRDTSSIPHSWWIDPEGELRRDLPIADLHRVMKEQIGELWIDVDVSNRHHIAFLEHVCGFHPLSVEDVMNPDSRVKLEEYPGYLFMIIRGVRFHDQTPDPYDLETYNVCFFLGASFVVTAHGGQSQAIAQIAERMDRNPELLKRGAERLMHAITDSSVDAYFPLLERIDEFIDGLEERVFKSFDRAALQEIFEVKRVVLSLRRHLSPQREVFNIITNRPSPFLAPEAQVYFRDVYDHMLRINDNIDTYRELLGSVLDAYLTQVSNRLGSVTKGLSVVATMSIPFVVISGMWGMNFQHIPWANFPHAFWWMLVIQLAVGGVLLLLLRLLRLI
jgi:magnesium transporter